MAPDLIGGLESPSKTRRRIVGAIAFLFFVVVDTELTMRGVGEDGIVEGNPIMRPAVRRGRVAVYPIKIGLWALCHFRGHDSILNLASVGAYATVHNLLFKRARDWMYGR